MLNRKTSKSAHAASNRSNGHRAKEAVKPKPLRRRFIISPKAAGQHLHATPPQPPKPSKPAKDLKAAANGIDPKAAAAAPVPGAPAIPGQSADLTETIKTLLHLAQEHGHVTYDDINDVLPDGLSPGGSRRALYQAAQSRCRDCRPGRSRRVQASRSRKRKKIHAWRFWMTRSGCT